MNEKRGGKGRGTIGPVDSLPRREQLQCECSRIGCDGVEQRDRSGSDLREVL